MANQAWWLDPLEFSRPEFDADKYVANLRKNVPLETLSNELGEHLSSLKLQLVEVINADYADFVSLSTQLVNVDGAVARMQTPLVTLKDQMSTVSDSISNELATLKLCLQRQAAVAQLRATLELMQDAAHVMPKVEKLLGEVDSATPGKEGLDERLRLYDRVASEVSRLQYYEAKGAGIPFLERLKPRMDDARNNLQARLAEGLEAALEHHNDAAVVVALHSYAAIADTAGAEAVVRRLVAKPLVAKALHNHQCTNQRTASESLSGALAEILQGVEQYLGSLIESAAAPNSGLHAFDFLGACLLPEVDEAIAAALPGCFSPGVPSVFLASYCAAFDFLVTLEASHVHSSRALSVFRAAPAGEKLLRRWNLPIYFSIRFQEIASALDAAASEKSLQRVTASECRPSTADVQLKVSAELIGALQRTISPEVFLQPLADKFIRLALQLTSRYVSWLRLGVGNPNVAAEDVSQLTPQQEGETEAQQAALWETAEEVSLVWGEVHAVVSWLRNNYREQLLTVLAFLPNQVTASVAAAWDEGVAEMEAITSSLRDVVVTALAMRCAGVLKAMRGIATTYRMVARPMPKRPSPFVSSVLQPLRTFLGDPSASTLPEDVSQSVCRATISAVCQHFQAAAGSLLDAERKTESSLKRLNRNRAGETPSDATAGASNTDKMAAQLFLDVQELGRQVFKFDMDPSDMGPFSELWASIAPEGQKEIDSSLLLG